MGASNNIKAKLELNLKCMNQLRQLYYRLQVRILDIQQDFSIYLMRHELISREDFQDHFNKYLQRKYQLNQRIQRLGGLV